MSFPARAPALMSDDDRHGLHVVPMPVVESSPYPKASILLRAGARLADLCLAVAIYRITGPAGAVVGLLYLLFADGMLQGQSPGKKLFGVKVIYLPTRSPARHRDSVLRNAPFGLVVLLGLMPEVGFHAFLGGAVLVGGLETWKVLRDPLGMRLGDSWAETQVVDGKVVAGQPMVRSTADARAPGRVMREALPRRARAARCAAIHD